MWALTVVAPIVRFNALDILATPTFLRASDFNSRTSDGVHARLTNFFLAISIPVPVYVSRASNTSCLVINIRKLHNSDILCRRTTIAAQAAPPPTPRASPRLPDLVRASEPPKSISSFVSLRLELFPTNPKNHTRAVRYRQLALADPDKAKAAILLAIARCLFAANCHYRGATGYLKPP
jgi:hypothetical protein